MKQWLDADTYEEAKEIQKTYDGDIRKIQNNGKVFYRVYYYSD